MGIKRWKLYSDYGDSAMCETGNQPAGHWHPVSEDDYVLHADHAAEVARLEARVAELEWANGYASKVVGKLRAQLEAAKAQLTAQPDGVAVPKSLDIVLSTMRLALNLAEAEGEKPVQMDFKSAETLYVAARLLQKTAAPAREDGVRERRLELALAEIEGRSNVTTGGHSTLAQRLERIHALAAQALAAPAPDYDPKPDWRCQACEETGARHCSDPANCGGMKAPAPACKTCGDDREVTVYGGVNKDVPDLKPCPDCAKGERHG